jgi:flagellar motor component MotA
MSSMVGRLCYLADKADGNTPKDIDEREELLRRSEIGWFAAEHFFSLGLLGTVFGLCVATATNLDAEAPVSAIVAGLKEGLNTAFYTTICGIVFSLPLQVQLMILKYEVDKND